MPSSDISTTNSGADVTSGYFTWVKVGDQYPQRLHDGSLYVEVFSGNLEPPMTSYAWRLAGLKLALLRERLERHAQRWCR